MKELIRKWLGAVSQVDFDKLDEFTISNISRLEGLNFTQHAYINETMIDHIRNSHTEPVITPVDFFDPKIEPYPEEIRGMKLDFVAVKEECCLWLPDKDRVLYPFENEEWGDNTKARRVMVSPTRLAVAIDKEGTEYRYDPRPYLFDGGDLAYRVCPAQVIGGKELWSRPDLYLLVSDCV